MVEAYVLILIFILGSIVWTSWKCGITPTPTSSKVKNALIPLLPHIQNEKIVELGSGFGTLAFSLARHFPDCTVYAYEISFIPYLFSKALLFGFGLPNLFIERRDFFSIPLDKFSLVVCYLYPGAMERLKEKFEKELSPNTYVLTHTFAVPGWKPLLMERAKDLYQTPIYLYQLKISTSS